MDRHDITDGLLHATVLARGAELCSLRDAAGDEYLWQALPAWPRHAPVLFPIVGRLAGDALHHDGHTYRLTQHGFARDRTFSWVERSPTACRLALTDDAETRPAYPFAFRFELSYAIADGVLATTFTIRNPGAETLPAAMGAHPGFAWPLRPGAPKTAHVVRFAVAEPAPIRRLAGGLVKPEAFPTPVRGDTLALTEDLFAADAMILDQPASRSVRYGLPGGPAIEVGWDGFRELGLWMKPGADFLCIEPWLGTASPVGFDGPFIDKPGITLIPPGGEVSATMTIRKSSNFD